MHRTDLAPFHARFPQGAAHTWLTRRWYYTPRSHRAYSVRQISPGDRRLLAEFALTLGQHTADRELAAVQDLSDMLFERVIAGGADNAVGFAALENTAGGDRVIGVAAYAPASDDERQFQSCGGAYASRGTGRAHSAGHAGSPCETRLRAAPDRRDALVQPADADARHVHGFRGRARAARSQPSPPRAAAQVSH